MEYFREKPNSSAPPGVATMVIEHVLAERGRRRRDLVVANEAWRERNLIAERRLRTMARLHMEGRLVSSPDGWRAKISVFSRALTSVMPLEQMLDHVFETEGERPPKFRATVTVALIKPRECEDVALVRGGEQPVGDLMA